MGFGEAISVGFSKYVVFAGRASRSEYWFWVLFTLIASIACAVIDAVLGIRVLDPLFSLATFLPSLAVSVRRLHDIDRTGWWFLLWFVPLIGWIVLLVFACRRGDDGPNRFGPPPFSGWSNYRGRLA